MVIPEAPQNSPLKIRRHMPIAELRANARPLRKDGVGCEFQIGVRPPGRWIRPPVPSVSGWQRPRCSAPIPPSTTIAPIAPTSGALRSRLHQSTAFRIFSISNGNHSQTRVTDSPSATEQTFPGARSITFIPAEARAKLSESSQRERFPGAYAPQGIAPAGRIRQPGQLPYRAERRRLFA
jgi:hypothetical protein